MPERPPQALTADPAERPASVRRLGREDEPAATDVLCRAFHEYPVMRFVLGPDGPEYGRRLALLIRMFVMARLLRDEPILGVLTDGGLAGVALVSDPNGPPTPVGFQELREAVWQSLGAAARARYESCGKVWASFDPPDPHLHLNMLGVPPELQGRGLSRFLLDEVHRLAEERPGCTGVTLNTETAANLRLYEHFGYRVTGHARLGEGLESWWMFRSQ